MNVQLILCHPYQQSFNQALAVQAKSSLESAGHWVNFHDLYRERFDPLITYNELIGDCNDPLVNKHIEELKSADGVVIVHPNWWGKPPALLSGWIDRVLRMNIAYMFSKGEQGGAPIGLLNLKKAVIINTSNTTPEREASIFGDPLETIWKNCVFDFCGVNLYCASVTLSNHTTGPLSKFPVSDI